jgi:hypothetical protein
MVSSKAFAQTSDEVIDPILRQLVWKDPVEYRRLVDLAFTTLNLRAIYPNQFKEITGTAAVDFPVYGQTIIRYLGGSPDEHVAKIEELLALFPSDVENIYQAFSGSLQGNGGKFIAWLTAIGLEAERYWQLISFVLKHCSHLPFLSETEPNLSQS